MPLNPLVLIPSRLQATRLPAKPLKDIHGKPMIVHVWERAMDADVGPVFVACDTVSIRDAVHDHGGQAVLTASDHPSGTDRIFEALGKIDADEAHDVIINVQGDLPTVEKETIMACLTPFTLENSQTDISTVATIIDNNDDRDNPNVVKIVASPENAKQMRALYFTRAMAPTGPGPQFHHIGLYGYRREALTRFVALPPSPLELREKLEQLRALEAGMRIDVTVVEAQPLGVDAPDDLERARVLLAPQ